MVWYVNKGKVVKLCGSNDCLMSGSQKTTKHSVVKDRRPSLPLETLSGQPEDRLHGGQKSNPLGIDSDTDAACEIVFQSRRRNLMTCVMGWGARIWMRLRSAHFVLGLSMVCRETVHSVIENGSANRVASAGSLLLCCSYCRTKYVRLWVNLLMIPGTERSEAKLHFWTEVGEQGVTQWSLINQLWVREHKLLLRVSLSQIMVPERKACLTQWCSVP